MVLPQPLPSRDSKTSRKETNRRHKKRKKRGMENKCEQSYNKALGKPRTLVWAVSGLRERVPEEAAPELS